MRNKDKSKTTFPLSLTSSQVQLHSCLFYLPTASRAVEQGMGVVVGSSYVVSSPASSSCSSPASMWKAQL